MKKLSIMQPYFFPYIGYFSLIEKSEKFVFFDTPQYIHHGWVNRNRILNQKGEPAYITVPIKKASQATPIRNIRIDYSQEWKNKIWGMLTVYKKKAPHYNQVCELLHDILDKEYEFLAQLNIQSTMEVCKYLGINTKFEKFSDIKIEIPEVKEPGEWALYITEVLGYKHYINPSGGRELFKKEKYRAKGIALEFMEIELKPYVQKTGHFEQALSIIDVMMFCNKSEITDML